MTITSASNPIIKKFAALSDKKYRRVYGEYLVEGVKPVSECVSRGGEVTAIVCTESLKDRYAGATVVSDALFAKISSEKTPQGVIASVKLPQSSLCAPGGNCLLLDRVRDPGNLGTIIRTANAAGYEDLYLIDCADAFSPKAVRASMGGVFFVNIREGSLDEVLTALRGVPLITADMDGENIFSFTSPQKFCLCIGNEGGGVCDEIKKASDFVISIPMRETCESLNAGVSAAIAMYTLKNKI